MMGYLMQEGMGNTGEVQERRGLIACRSGVGNAECGNIARCLVHCRVMPTYDPQNLLPVCVAAQTLFYMAIGMGLVLVWMALKHFLWADSFFMQASSVLGCPRYFAPSLLHVQREMPMSWHLRGTGGAARK